MAQLLFFIRKIWNLSTKFLNRTCECYFLFCAEIVFLRIFSYNKSGDINILEGEYMTIFFDVDGVLNTKADWQYKYVINPDCVRAFAELVKALSKSMPVQLIICSTWRAGIGSDGNDSRQMQNLSKALSAYGLKISGSTPLSNKDRQAEIEYFIRRNNIQNYLILDDDPSLFTSPETLTLYVPDYHTGLTMADLKPIIKMCKKEMG